jgi:HD-GYP domain-containing protein (c-di-GMP phosphodiesterase class II)
MSEEEKQRMAPKYSEETKKTLSKTIDELFLRITSTLRLAQIFEPNNETFIHQLRPLFFLIQGMLKNLGKAILQFRGNALFFNAIRIKFDFNSYQRFKFLVGELKENEIEAIGFEPGLTAEELTLFIVILAKAKERKLRHFEDFEAAMESGGIKHIFLEKLHDYETSLRMTPEEVKRSCKKVFMKSIVHLHEVMEREKKHEKLHFKTTRRLIQTIINLISYDESFMLGLTNIKNYEEYTLNHSINVTILALAFGRRLGLEKTDLVDLGMSAFFHDIGKLEIPLEVLNKKGKLDDEEWQIMQEHPIRGVTKLVLLQDLSYFPIRALSVAMEHHVWANHSGYPKNWKKKDLNLYSKIVKICDVFDAITTKRVYRDFSFTRQQALSMMFEKIGEEYDSLLLKVFAGMIGVFPVGSLVSLNTGEIGVVVETNQEEAFMLRPKVKLIADSNKHKIDGEIIDLAEKDPETGQFKRTVVNVLDPEKYEINIPDYFLVQALG